MYNESESLFTRPNTREDADGLRTSAHATDDAALTLIEEQATNRMSFNVMPDREVTETLHIKAYRVGNRYAEARFDRTYASAMRSSPSHLIFLSAVAHLQKIAYVYGCHHLGLPYDPHGPELLKVWPTNIKISMDRMIRDESELVHRVYVDRFEQVAPKRYAVAVNSNVNGILHINAETPLFVL